MQELIMRLTALLYESEQTLQELLDILAEERRSLMQMETARLEDLTFDKQVLHERLQVASCKYRQLLSLLAEAVGVPGATTLSPLLSKLPQPQSGELRELQGRLLKLGRRLEQLGNENERLLSNALSTVNRSLDFFGRIFSRSATYSGNGGVTSVGTAPRRVCGEA